MEKITFSLFAALGLILASMLLPGVNAFAAVAPVAVAGAPTCSCGALEPGSCTCYCPSGTQHTLPMTLKASGTSTNNYSLPFHDTDPNSTYHQSLPTPIIGNSNPTATCANGCSPSVVNKSCTCPSTDVCKKS